jgi:hypothetical protein
VAPTTPWVEAPRGSRAGIAWPAAAASRPFAFITSNPHKGVDMRVRTIAGLASVAALAAFGIGSTVVGANTSAGEEHVVISAASATAPQTIQMFGPITGTGIDRTVTDNQDKATFKNGTFLIDHFKTSSTHNNDAKNCVFDYLEQGRYTVHGGTGAYKNVHGKGTYNLEVLGQGCDEKKPPKEFSIVVHAAGPLSVG